jgi:hypothetical protein
MRMTKKGREAHRARARAEELNPVRRAKGVRGKALATQTRVGLPELRAIQNTVRITPGPGELSCKRRRRSDRQRFHWETMVEPRLKTARERADPRDAALS